MWNPCRNYQEVGNIWPIGQSGTHLVCPCQSNCRWYSASVTPQRLTFDNSVGSAKDAVNTQMGLGRKKGSPCTIHTLNTQPYMKQFVNEPSLQHGISTSSILGTHKVSDVFSEDSGFTSMLFFLWATRYPSQLSICAVTVARKQPSTHQRGNSRPCDQHKTRLTNKPCAAWDQKLP